MTTKNIQDAVAERVEEFEKRFGSFTFDNGGALDFTLWDVVDERVHQTDEVGVVMQDWLTTTLTHLVKEVKAEERERIHTILEDQLGKCDEYEEGCPTCDIWKALNDEQIERT